MAHKRAWGFGGRLAAVLFFAAGTAAGAGAEVSLTGTGASFPQPIYDKWFKAFQQAHPSVRVNYTATGSGAGVNQFLKETVDFGASDEVLKESEVAKAKRGVKLIPLTAGAVVVAYNLPDVKTPLKLSRPVLVGLFDGSISNWNDPKLAADNPGVMLPDLAVAPVVRAESSGTTAVFTKHLAALGWAAGSGKTVKWPAATTQKGQKNDGVAKLVKQNPGAIGYMEFQFAKSAGLPAATLQNKRLKFVEANPASGKAALAAIKMPADLTGSDPDPDGDDVYPIVTFTWLLLPGEFADADKAKAAKDLVTYCLTEGQAEAEALGYIPLPEAVAKQAQEAVQAVKP